MKANLRTPSPISSFFPGSISLPNSLPPPLKQWRGMRYGYCMEGGMRYGQFIKLCLCLTFLFTLFTCSSMGFHPPYILLTLILPMGCNSSQTVWFPLMECGPSGTDSSITGPPWGHRSWQKTCPSVGYFSWLH